MRRCTVAVLGGMAVLLAACGGGDSEPGAQTSPPPAPSASTSTIEELAIPNGSYRSEKYTAAAIRAIVPEKYEHGLLENELEGGDAVVVTIELSDGQFAWFYSVDGVDKGVGLQGIYEATPEDLCFVEGGATGGPCDITTAWNLKGDILSLDLDERSVPPAPAKWYLTYIFSEPFTRVA
jgi:hypothetical protein